MFKTKKSLGQNFLQSKSIVGKIISVSNIKKDGLILEVGPGQGFLTEDLIEASKNVLCIEKDDRLADVLQEKFNKEINEGYLEIFHDDILKFELGIIYRDYKVIANIPYYITGQIIKKFLTAKNKPKSMTLMIQKEVAQRICAKDGKESLLSLSVKLFGKPKYIKTVKKEKFNPPPKVDSAVLLIDEIDESPFDRKEQEVLFFELIRKSFNQKRKTVGKTLKLYEVALKRSKIDTKSRPEDLKLEDWIRFVKNL